MRRVTRSQNSALLSRSNSKIKTDKQEPVFTKKKRKLIVPTSADASSRNSNAKTKKQDSKVVRKQSEPNALDELNVTAATSSQNSVLGNAKQESIIAKKPAPPKSSISDSDKAIISGFSSTNTGKMFVGAHVSAAGGVHKAVENAHAIGCKAFALFLKSQRQWNSKPLDSDIIRLFKELCEKHEYKPHLIVPHGSYLMNCGTPNPEILEKSRKCLIEELKRCEQLGLTRYNFHPGSTCGQISVEKSISQIAECINDALAQTNGVTAVIENMCCQGNTIGGKFEELAAIIDKVNDKERIGVCLDTCHAYAAGFDLTSDEGYENMMSQFIDVIGLKYLKAMHINDSKGDLGCHLDRHECLGKGKLGTATFARVMNDKRLVDVPLILETPGGNQVWRKEIQLMYSLQN